MKFTQEQAEEMYDALRSAYGLTAGMAEDIARVGQDFNAADLTCARRHMLTALREAGFGGGHAAA